MQQQLAQPVSASNLFRNIGGILIDSLSRLQNPMGDPTVTQQAPPPTNTQYYAADPNQGAGL
jgi:hypothetical protein